MKTHHLVMVNTPGQQAVEDFIEIRARIERSHLGIEVFIANNLQRNVGLEQAALRRPTLVMSPLPLFRFKPLRGRVHYGLSVEKLAQLRRMGELGVTVPKWAIAGPDVKPAAEEWGPFLILKPAGAKSAYGGSMSIVPTAKYRYRAPHEYPEDHLGRKVPMIVQSFIVTGDCASSYRVNTLYGEALYCMHSECRSPLPALAELAGEEVSEAIATNNLDFDKGRNTLVNDPDVLELARRAHAGFPDIPVKGIDIVREADSGRLFVLELNCLSSTWHISSGYATEHRSGELSREHRVKQFGAWDVAARVLAEQTLSKAM